MKKYFYEGREELCSTVADMVTVLLTVPAGYTLNPMGEQCTVAVDHYNKCVYVDTPSFIDENEKYTQESIKDDGASEIVEVSENEIRPFHLFYVWQQIGEVDGEYTYFLTLETAKGFYDSIEGSKTYGIATFKENKLEPIEVIGSEIGKEVTA